MLSKERSLRIQYSCREKRDVNFFKWPIAGNSSESAPWSTKVTRQSGIQGQYHLVANDYLQRERKTGLCGVQYGHELSQAGILPSVSSEHDTAIFSTDYSSFKISVQTAPLARRARLSHGENVLQHASRVQAVEQS